MVIIFEWHPDHTYFYVILLICEFITSYGPPNKHSKHKYHEFKQHWLFFFRSPQNAQFKRIQQRTHNTCAGGRQSQVVYHSRPRYSAMRCCSLVYSDRSHWIQLLLPPLLWQTGVKVIQTSARAQNSSFVACTGDPGSGLLAVASVYPFFVASGILWYPQ